MEGKVQAGKRLFPSSSLLVLVIANVLMANDSRGSSSRIEFWLLNFLDDSPRSGGEGVLGVRSRMIFCKWRG